MRELAIDLWDGALDVDVRCITTNGTVRNGRNVMGGGCAREAADRDAELPERYGRLIELHDNHVFLIGNLVMFPVKHEVSQRASAILIARSAYELKELAAIYDWQAIALPRPGCGLGGLSWEREVRPWLVNLLDDRFVIIDFPALQQ